MEARDVMTADVRTCRPEDSLAEAARIMWEGDCGCVPVVDRERRVIGVITDRDVCMAAYLQGKRLAEASVGSAMSHQVFACTDDETVEELEAVMRLRRVRRVPITDRQGRLLGIVSLNDLARRASAHRTDGLSTESVTGTLAALSEPWAPRAAAAE